MEEENEKYKRVFETEKEEKDQEVLTRGTNNVIRVNTKEASARIQERKLQMCEKPYPWRLEPESMN